MKFLSTKYHRNGVCGIGFYRVDFEDDGEKLLALVFPPDDDDVAEGKRPESYAVVNPENMNARYRGDHFIDAIWEHILKVRNTKEIHI